MFGNVWKWAGKYRTSEKNIGVICYHISTEVKKLCDDVSTWVEFKSYSKDEIAARLHHRLVKVHPFANGNGRHARLVSDLLLEKALGKPVFSWGSVNLVKASETRSQYIASLREADKGDYANLLAFVRS